MNNKDIISEMKNTDDRIIVIGGSDSVLYLWLVNGRIKSFKLDYCNKLSIGDIIVARVDKINYDAGGIFLTLCDGVKAYLPKDEIVNPIVNGIKSTIDKIHVNDSVVVQIQKEAYDNKLIGVTTYFELKRKYIIASTKNKSLSFSKKMTNETKELLKSHFSEISNESILFRTECNNADLEIIDNDVNNTYELINNIYKEASFSPIYKILYKAPSGLADFFIEKTIPENTKVIVDSDDLYSQFCNDINVPEYVKNNVSIYSDEDLSIISLYGLKKLWSDITDEKVWLKNGGYIFVSSTPAFNIIDVNIGKAIYNNSNKDSSFLLNNDAINEIVYQIEARNLSGMILIDFINMKKSDDRNILIENLKKQLNSIKPVGKFIDITKLGIVEITRQKNHADIYSIKEYVNKNILR